MQLPPARCDQGLRLRPRARIGPLSPTWVVPPSRRQIREALGIRRTVVSGGGSLAAHLDDFYEAIGLPVLNGWGLTETSPVLACRRPDRVGPGRGAWGSRGERAASHHDIRKAQRWVRPMA